MILAISLISCSCFLVKSKFLDMESATVSLIISSSISAMGCVIPGLPKLPIEDRQYNKL